MGGTLPASADDTHANVCSSEVITSVPAVARNIEFKATDPDPAATLAAARALGAEDHGLLHQRDTYFNVATGRLKLRVEDKRGAQLIQYARADASGQARESTYVRVDVPDPDGLRTALAASAGVRAEVVKARHLLVHDGVRVHLDRVEGLASSYVELEAVDGQGASGRPAAERAETVREALGIAADRIVPGSYADLLAGADALVAAARAAMARAYVPYSRYRVGAALRAPDGSIHAAANVENAAYPQGQCAEASAIGVLVAAGHTSATEAAVIASGPDVCVPCGGCRQRLREFMPLDAPVQLCSGPTGERVTVTLEELLPRSFGPDFLAHAAGAEGGERG
jgi:homotetrameric cytidine deaminase